MPRFFDLENLNALLDEVYHLPDENARIGVLCDAFLRGSRIEDYPPDPFSSAYAETVLETWKAISGRPYYDANVSEQATYLSAPVKHYRPSIYEYNSSTFLSRYFVAIGAILRTLEVDSSHAVLEYGAGDGQISIALARMGCSVSVIDVEDRYLQLIQSQCSDLGITIDTHRGVFGDNFDDGRKFDRILFFESFHHGMDHQAAILKLSAMLKPGGSVVFAGEPVVHPQGHWAMAVPFPWGPRLDGLSVRASRAHGWCELGFQQPYFVEMLIRSGFAVRLAACEHEGLGTCFVATPYGNQFEPGSDQLIEVHGDVAGWFAPEGKSRWTGERAVLPLPGGRTRASLDIANPLPVAKAVMIRAGAQVISRELAPAQRETIEIAIPSDVRRLEIEATAHRPSELAQSIDDRALGVQVFTVTYQ